mmetsp:Transcript_16659/g.21609  ORF Transcript_16659/g.21609 Transcript_16659/m.21609 type:complete len:333 (+) Transcript_16659:233-1231(+)
MAGKVWGELAVLLALAMSFISQALIMSHGQTPSTMQKNWLQRTKPISIAHRGSSATFPGNTIEAFLEADRVGAEMIELDIAVCKSGEILVHHDPYLPDGSLLRDAEYDHIKKVFPNIVTLREVLSALQDSSIKLYLDMKGQHIVQPTLQLLYDVVNNGSWEPTRFLVATFNQYDLLKVAAYKQKYQLLKSIETIVIIDSVPFGYAKSLAKLQVNYISVGQGCIVPEFVEDAHKRGIKVMAWTVNNVNMMKHFMSIGVYGICTDYPEKVAEVQSEMRSQFMNSNAGMESSLCSSPAEVDFADPCTYLESLIKDDIEFSLQLDRIQQQQQQLNI